MLNTPLNFQLLCLSFLILSTIKQNTSNMDAPILSQQNSPCNSHANESTFPNQDM